MRRSWRLAITSIVAAALAALPMTTAAAAGAVLTVGSSTGPAVSVGDVLWGVLSGNAVFVISANSGQKITCTSSRIDGTVTANSTPSGPAAFNITSWTFGGCSTSGVFGTTVTGITTNATSSCPWNAAVSDSSGTNNVTITAASGSGCPASIVFTVSISTFGLSNNCLYNPLTGTITGSAPLGGSSISFSQSLTKTSGAGTCFGSLLFSAAYSFTDHTQGGGVVVFN